MSNELQKDDFILPGDLGNVIIGSTGKVSKVTESFKHNDGSVTITLSKVVDHYLNGIPVTEDADFEVVSALPLLDEKKQEEDKQFYLNSFYEDLPTKAIAEGKENANVSDTRKGYSNS